LLSKKEANPKQVIKSEENKKRLREKKIFKN
jgi:hypothetical protein